MVKEEKEGERENKEIGRGATVCPRKKATARIETNKQGKLERSGTDREKQKNND
jgi:hypothetical protein